eukprot:TRINITY_DN67259_c11_g2_i1.p1 TRINITY_DN67259_c11_g2~~TRINITY_DN67259_c11_g2_i1.p1  ORF type:complete len:762 (-),score=94.40 TRINITY_DN67259_c11_g2_i1:257-2542(-)
MSKKKQTQEKLERFQAVVLADSFTHDLKPVTYDCPRALLPLCNTPILDYTIELLISNGIEEIFIFCSSHADKLEEHIKKSRWGNSTEVTLRVLMSKNCETPGDALRHIHAQDVIRSDFVLLPADVITNFTQLKQLMQVHKLRREDDPSFLLTVVFQEDPANSTNVPSFPSSATLYPTSPAPGAFGSADPQPTFSTTSDMPADKMPEERTAVVINPANNQLLGYVPWYHIPTFQDFDVQQGTTDVTFPVSLMKDVPNVTVRSDLVDTNIVLCSPELLMLFKENFDFFDIKNDCIKGILDEELLGNKIGLEIVQLRFLERVRSFAYYSLLSQAVLTRWTFPLVPDIPFSGRGPRYHTRKNNIYLSPDCLLDRNVTIEQDSIIGSGSAINNGVTIANSSIGHNCRIGENSKLDGAFVWDNVKIGKNCTLHGCVICQDCVIEDNCIISSGTVLSVGVHISEGHITQEGSKIYIPDGEDDVVQEDAVGPKGKGKIWEPQEEELRVDVPAGGGAPDDSDDESLTERMEELLMDHVGGMPIIKSTGPAVLGKEKEEEDDDAHFLSEVVQTVQRGIEAGEGEKWSKDKVENTTLEINGLKFAFNKTFSDCLYGVVDAVVEYAEGRHAAPPTPASTSGSHTKATPPFQPQPTRSIKETRTQTLKLIENLQGVFQKLANSADIQLDLVQYIVSCATKYLVFSIGENTIPMVMKKLYDIDIITDEVILDWEQKATSRNDPIEQELLKKPLFQAFLEALKEDDEEEEEEEDED